MDNCNRSIKRAVIVLNHLITQDKGITLKELSGHTGLNSSTLYRILATLKKFDYVVKDNDTRYSIGPAVLSLANAYQKSFNLYKITNVFLSQLRDYCGETIHLSKRHNSEVLYLVKLAGLEAIGVITENIGERSPLHCTAVGKVILANLSQDELSNVFDGYTFQRRTPKTITNKDDLLMELEEIRNIGYAFNREENSVGLAAISAPVFDINGIFGGVSISGLASRIYEKTATGELVNELLSVCKEISISLGGGGFSEHFK